MEKFLASKKDEMIENLATLIRFKSVKSAPLPGAPFGQGVKDALDFLLKLGEDLGFRVKNLDSFAGTIEFGSGDEMIGILAHTDVVPEGDGWSYPPFGAEIHESKMFGRGTLDDKGPLMAALYAMLAVKESGVPLSKRVRLIIGCDEESGWACMDRYKETEELPVAAFTPDADFPVIFAEKGILHGSFLWEGSDLPFTLKGGTRPNVVPHYVSGTLLGEAIEAHGVSAHAAHPELGENAISKMIASLSQKCTHPTLAFLETAMTAEGLHIAQSDEVSGKLTYNPAVILADEKGLSLQFDIRYPVTADRDALVKALEQAATQQGFHFQIDSETPPLYVPKDTPLVKTLMEVYQEKTGDTKAEPIAIGGGTYARAMDNAVAFGSVFPGQESPMHEKNEYIPLDLLLKNAEIYAEAILRLAK